MDKHLHREEDNKEKKEKEFFSNLTPAYDRSKEQVWASLSEQIDKSEQKPIGKVRPLYPILKYMAAATVIMMVGLGAYAKFYLKEVKSAYGEQLVYELPDGSKINLNADSKISYHPYWWSIDRALELEGEAFFEVEKGSKFSVYSGENKTSVLGTSFNIMARGAVYNVFCKTGKVVVENEGSSVILAPGNQALLDDKGTLTQRVDVSEVNAMPWRLNKFVYNTTPLNIVLDDIQRHYDVKISLLTPTNDYLYTGFFDRSVTVDQAIEIICHSFDLNFSKNKEGYEISKK